MLREEALMGSQYIEMNTAGQILHEDRTPPDPSTQVSFPTRDPEAEKVVIDHDPDGIHDIPSISAVIRKTVDDAVRPAQRLARKICTDPTLRITVISIFSGIALAGWVGVTNMGMGAATIPPPAKPLPADYPMPQAAPLAPTVQAPATPVRVRPPHFKSR
jgi:hypothetical protein